MPFAEIEGNPWETAPPAAGKFAEIEDNPWEPKTPIGATTAQRGVPEQAAGVAKAYGTGLAKGTVGLAGTGGDVRALGGQVFDWLARQAGLTQPTLSGQITGAPPPLSPGVQAFKNLAGGAVSHLPMIGPLLGGPTSQQLGSAMQKVTGPSYQPQGTLEQGAERLGEFTPNIAFGPEGLLQRAVTNVALPAAGSLLGEAVTKGTAAEPYGAAAGALVGGAAAPAAFGAGRRVITPFAAAPEKVEAMRILRNEGVTAVPAGMSVGSEGLSAAESELARSKYKTQVNKAYDQFTQAALNRAEIEGKRATPEVLNKARSDIGDQFDQVAARNPSIPVGGVHPTLDAIRQDLINLTGSSNPYLDNLPARIGNDISGRNYQTISSELARYQRTTSNPELKMAYGDTKNALEAAVEHGLSDPKDIAQWQNARRRWANLLTIENTVNSSKQTAAEGLITPPDLSNAIKRQSPKAYVRGQGDFSDLARAGNVILKPFQDSGTATRAWTRALPGLLLGLAGGVVHPAGLALAAGPWTTGKALMSPPVQAWLRNQRAAGFRGVPATGGLLPAAIAGQQQTPYGAQ